MKLGRDLTRWERAVGFDVLLKVAQRAGAPVKLILKRGRGLRKDALIKDLYEALRAEAGWSFTKIASFTGRDHTTVLQSLKGRRDGKGVLRGREKLQTTFPIEEAASNLALLALRAGRAIS